MLEDSTQELSAIKPQLQKYFMDFLDIPHEEFIDALLFHIVKVLNVLYIKGESAMLYKHQVKKVIFDHITKDMKVVEIWNPRPILWLRDEIFDFLVIHHFIIETVPEGMGQIRTSYSLGSKAIRIFMDFWANGVIYAICKFIKLPIAFKTLIKVVKVSEMTIRQRYKEVLNTVDLLKIIPIERIPFIRIFKLFNLLFEKLGKMHDSYKIKIKIFLIF